MATSHAKLIFVLIFVLNCLLWSQSRYASVEGSFGEGLRHQLTPARLLKRSLGIWNEADGDQVRWSMVLAICLVVVESHSAHAASMNRVYTSGSL
jgi:hypothetical protein